MAAYTFGDSLCYFDRWIQDYRFGKVINIFEYNGIVYYILEIEVPIIGDTFIEMVSECSVFESITGVRND